MNWPWLIGCFVLWLAAGYWFARSVPELARLAIRYRRAVRGAIGFIGLLGAAGILFGLLANLPAQGSSDSLTARHWFQILIGGLAFVGAQCLAVAFILSLVLPGVTIGQARPSKNQDPEGIDS